MHNPDSSARSVGGMSTRSVGSVGSTVSTRTRGSPKPTPGSLKRNTSFNAGVGTATVPEVFVDADGDTPEGQTAAMKKQKPVEELPYFVWTQGGSVAGDVSDDSVGSARFGLSSSCSNLELLAGSSVVEMDEEAKRERRLAKNREAARIRRLRKRTRIDELSAKVREMEHLIGTMEAHKWGYTSLAGIDAVAEYEVNKDAYVSWPGAMTDKQFYGHEQACARRCVAAQLAAHDTIINIHGDNEYLVSLASARLNGSDDLGINQALAELNLSEEQAKAIMSQSRKVSAISSELQALSKSVSTAIASFASEPFPGGGELGPPLAPSSRRGSRNSLSSLDSEPGKPGGPLFQFPVVELFIKRLQSSGASPDQVTSFVTFCCENADRIAELPLPLPPAPAPAPSSNPPAVTAPPPIRTPVIPPLSTKAQPPSPLPPQPTDFPPTSTSPRATFVAPAAIAVAKAVPPPTPPFTLSGHTASIIPGSSIGLHTSISVDFSGLSVSVDAPAAPPPPPAAE